MRLDGGAEKGCSVNRAFVRTMLWGEWEGYWRLRVGEYRVIYEIDDRAHRVIIIRARHRSEAYDRPWARPYPARAARRSDPM